MAESTMEADLRVAVNLLTRETVHRIMVDGTDGVEVAKFVRQDSLLKQLRDAMRPGMEAKAGGGAGGDNGSPAPMSLDAYDLLQEIEEEMVAQYWLARNAGTELGRSLPLPVEQGIQHWAARIASSSRGDLLELADALKLTRRWVTAIESLFDPVHRMELVGSCPECGESSYRAEVDGEMVRKPALTAGWSAGGGAVASCGLCSKQWAGFDLHALADHVTREPGVVVVNPG